MLSTGVRQPDVAAARTGIRFRDVDPAAHAPEAAALLRQSWAAPCLRYSDAYVKWQLTFPGAVPSRAVSASDDGLTVGFVALIPREIATPNGPASIYVMTFFAVHPRYRGARVGSELARRIVEISDRPILTYTEPGSHSERAFMQSAAARRWTFRHVAVLRTYAGGASPRPEGSIVARPATVEEFIAATRTREPASVAWSQPTLAPARHYLSDPRGACFAVAEGKHGETLGAALIVRSEVLTADGAEDVPAVDMVHLRDRHAETLSAFRMFALERWKGPSIVTAPNLDVVPAAAIRQSGFRATRSAFNVAILGDPAELLTREVVSTNLEVF
jgi:GNAT superfamily N-acetyltransferase